MTEITTDADGVSTVTFRERTWYARLRSVPGAPHSSLTQLIQGIWETEPEQARAILRRRIRTTDPLSPMNWGMVKTAAQRVTSVTSLDILPSWSPVTYRADAALPRLAAGEEGLGPMDLAFALAGRARRREELYRSDRPVGCVLVAASGERIAWAHNSNSTNRTRHAEVCLVQGLQERTGGGPPAGSTLYTTLEPCRMCQGMLHDAAPGVRILYAAADRVGPVAWKLEMTLFPCTAAR